MLNHDSSLTARLLTKPVPVEYFNELLWPCFVQYNTPLLENDGACILNGELAADQLLNLVCPPFLTLISDQKKFRLWN